MEKRALLAIVLSLLVLYVWSALFPAPRPSPLPKESQPNVDKQVMEYPLPAKLIPKVTPSPSTEEIKIIENKNLKLFFSNIGGVLKHFELNNEEHKFPEVSFVRLENDQSDSFTLQTFSPTEVVYTLVKEGTNLTKRYRVINEHMLKVSVEIESQMSRLDNITFSILEIKTNNLDKLVIEGIYRSLLEYSIMALEKTLRKGDAFRFLNKEKRKDQGTVKLVGYRDRYNCLVVKPEFPSHNYAVDPITENHLALKVDSDLKAGEKVFNFSIYLGPQDVRLMKSYNRGFEEIVAFSGIGFFDSFAKFLYWLFEIMHKIIPSWGVCIIIVGCLIYLVTYPLTLRGMSSMRRMQLLQPEMAILREKYKSNPQKLNKEVMELYRRHKVNPFGGCFIFLLQMPIFIAIYQVLWRSVLFKGAGFLWIKDLSQPDQLMLLPYALPIIGNEINILPFVMAVIMFLQQKLSMKNVVITDPTQATQQKIMLIFFPIFLGFIFYKFSSGLVLYFTVFYALSTLTQLKMSKLTEVKAHG